jgi:hypothetical protein
MRSTIFFPLLLLVATAVQPANCQNDKGDLPYYEIPSYPAAFSAGTVAARVIDGLGYRYFWATQGLRDEDLKYKPSKDARTSMETLTHIYELSVIIVNATNKVPTVNGTEKPPTLFPELRKRTLENLKSASDKLKTATDKDMGDLDVIFKSETRSVEFPFWNLLNGPIADVLWHVGQVVSFRRSSGNPFNENANVFTGKTKG